MNDNEGFFFLPCTAIYQFTDFISAPVVLLAGLAQQADDSSALSAASSHAMIQTHLLTLLRRSFDYICDNACFSNRTLSASVLQLGLAQNFQGATTIRIFHTTLLLLSPWLHCSVTACEKNSLLGCTEPLYEKLEQNQ